MANFTNRIQVLIDVVTGQSTSNVGKLRTEIANTEGAFGKMRVASAGAFDLIKQHAATAALAAGTAIVGFAVKAVGDFQDVALGAGQLSSSLGVTTEEASRLQEVTGDLGIGVSTVERGIGRMNREIANSPEKFDAIGAAIARNKDGTVNVTETFLNVVDALNKIPDPARRAAAAQEVLGRGWQDMSRLIALGADGVRNSLDRVEKQKIVSPEQVRQAEDLRDSLDELKGRAEATTLAVGGQLVPALNELLEATNTLLSPLEALPDQVLDIGATALLGVPRLLKFAEGLNTVKDALTGGPDITASFDESTIAASEFGDELDEVTPKVDNAALRAQALADRQASVAAATQDATDKLRDEADALTEQVDASRSAVDAGYAVESAQRAAADAVDNYNTTAADAEKTEREKTEALAEARDAAIDVAEASERQRDEMLKAAGATQTATQRTDFFNSSLLQQAANATGPVRDALVKHIAQLNGIPEEEATAILALMDEGKIAEAESRLAQTSRPRDVAMRADAQTAEAERRLNETARDRIARIQANVLGGIGADRRGHTGRSFGPEHDSLVVGRAGAEELVTFDNHTRRSGQVDSTETMRRNAAPAMQAGPLVSVGQIVVQNGESVEEALERFAWRARMATANGGSGRALS